MYLPKFLYATLPTTRQAVFDTSSKDQAKIKDIFNRAWNQLNSFILSDRSKNSVLVSHHRGSVDLYGDHGYYRVSAFINLVLHSTLDGRTVFSLLPRGGTSVVVSDTLKNATFHTNGFPTDRDENYTLPDEVIQLLTSFYTQPALNRLSISGLTIQQVREAINTFSDFEYIANEDIGAVIYNLLLLYVKLLKLVWLDPVQLDQNGNISDDDRIYVDYCHLYLYDQMSSLEGLQQLMRSYLLSGTHTEILNALSRVSEIGDGELTPDGFKIAETFFSSWTDGVFNAAHALAINYFNVVSNLHHFFENLPMYAAYIRIAKRFPNVLQNKPQLNDEFLIIYDLPLQVNCDPSESSAFIKDFETEYSELISQFKDMVNLFFVQANNLPNKGNPSIAGHYTELNGVNMIYGLNYSSPYQSNTLVITRFNDGDEFGKVKVNSPDNRRERLTKTLVRDETYAGINVRAIDEEQLGAAYLQAVLRSRQSLIIDKEAPISKIYNLRWDTVFGLVIPPINPVTDFKLESSLLPDNFPQDAESYTMYHIEIDDITLRMLPFIINMSDFSRAHSSTDAESELKKLFDSYFMTSLKVSNIGAEHYFQKINLGKSAILSAAALLAAYNTKYAEQAIKYIQVKINEELLNVRDQGCDIRIPRSILVPFPYATRESSAQQIRIMESNFNDHVYPSLIPEFDDRQLVGDGFSVFLNHDYSIFTDIYKLGVSRIQIKRNFFPNQLFTKARRSNDYTIRCVSLTDEYNPDAEKIGVLFGYSEQDFRDPYPTCNHAETSLNLLLGALTDITFGGIIGYDSYHDYRQAAATIIDVSNFWRGYYRSAGRVHMSSNFEIDKTWGELIDLLAPAVEASEAYLSNFDEGNSDYNALSTALVNSLNSFRDGQHLFWNQLGFVAKQLYFGCSLRLLTDKFAGRRRMELKRISFGEVGKIPTPMTLPGVTTANVKLNAYNNLHIILTNLLSKILYWEE